MKTRPAVRVQWLSKDGSDYQYVDVYLEAFLEGITGSFTLTDGSVVSVLKVPKSEQPETQKAGQK